LRQRGDKQIRKKDKPPTENVMVHHGINSAGQKVDSNGRLITNKQPQVDHLAALRETIGAITERVKALCAPTLANEVETEIAKYPGVAAIVNEATGTVATFALPKPYFQRGRPLPTHVSRLG
jgi:hypothetical protein